MQQTRLYFMLAFRNNSAAPNPVIAEVLMILKRKGVRIEIGFGESLLLQPEALSVQHDLYILKSHTDLWLSLAGVLHSQGAQILNPYLACRAAQNKIVIASMLRSAGVPIPRSWVTGDLKLLLSLAAERQLIMKPYDGRRGNGIRVVNEPRELASIPPPQRPVLVQEYVAGGDELKVYVIGDEVFAMRQPSSTNGCPRPRAACPVSLKVRRIALKCGQVSGLGLYGLDMVEGPDGPVVVDLNYFPSYRDVPKAATLIADYIEDYAKEHCPRLAVNQFAKGVA
jgi:ribosomal protein S6--L-glutamate ligase